MAGTDRTDVEPTAIGIGIDLDTRGFESALDGLERRSRAFGNALGGALRSAVVDGNGLESVLTTLALRLSDIALSAGLKPLENLVGQAVSGLGGALAGALPFAAGGVAGGAGQRIVPFAEGGVVRAPTFFPAGGDLGLMGEAGAEAILPLRRGADGRLGVAAAAGGEGGGAGRPIVFNVTTPDAASFRKSEAQISAMLARAVARGGRAL